jgi:hypothetical protein
MTTIHKRTHHPLLAQGRAARPPRINGVAARPADRHLLLDYPSAVHAPEQAAPAEYVCPICGRVGLNWPAHVALLLAVAVLGVIVGVWL